MRNTPYAPDTPRRFVFGPALLSHVASLEVTT